MGSPGEPTPRLELLSGKSACSLYCPGAGMAPGRASKGRNPFLQNFSMSASLILVNSPIRFKFQRLSGSEGPCSCWWRWLRYACWLCHRRERSEKHALVNASLTHLGCLQHDIQGQRMHCFESCCAIVARVCTRYRPERRCGSSDGTSDSFGRLHTWSLPSLRRAGSGSLAQFQDYIGHFPNNRTTGDKMFANQSLKLVGRMHTLFSTRLQTSRSTTCSESGAAGQCGNENGCLSLQLDGNLVLFFINTDTLICSSKTPELRDGRILAAMEMSGNLSR